MPVPVIPALGFHCVHYHPSQVAAALCATPAAGSQDRSRHYAVDHSLPCAHITAETIQRLIWHWIDRPLISN